ncbi:hypothetical protein L249_5626, partial [Ophiocordyceps polyrhachis-furcata BCC 54312]
ITITTITNLVRVLEGLTEATGQEILSELREVILGNLLSIDPNEQIYIPRARGAKDLPLDTDGPI